MRTVGEVAELASVTVRTLHHYDRIDLLAPSARSDAGYRLYAYEDLGRLQEILVWRQLGFSLTEIQTMLDTPGYDRLDALRRQRQLAGRELKRLGAVVRALEAAIAAQQTGTRLKEEAMFDGFDHSKYEAEARERWGHTDAYQESTRRAAGYGEEEWRTIRAEGDEITRDFAALLAAGEPASGDSARAVAERHRQLIARWFYPCSPELHRRLGEMYVADARFARNYEKVAAGLAEYVRDATIANAEEQATTLSP
jgi:MerR family transcriptional regulator, thiopeptide resistance regulator